MSMLHTLYAHGMHCKSCSVLIEDNLKNAPGVLRVRANHHTRIVEIETKDDMDSAQVARALTEYVRNDGYTLFVEKAKHEKRWGDFVIALPIALAFAILFALLQKTPFANLITSDTVTYPVAFFVGIIASVSTCLAVVGGLLLSISANYAKGEHEKKPQLLFHIGRLASFFFLGGSIGFIGSAFTLNILLTVIVTLTVGAVMLILGLNLLDIFPWIKRVQPHMPKFAARYASSLKGKSGFVTPFLLGAVTFFLPCGFTQSMQFYTLSTSSFLEGALTMTAFALGTLPVLALISFTSFTLGKGRTSSVFFKTAGLLVIAFAAINILNALAVLGVISPVVSF